MMKKLEYIGKILGLGVPGSYHIIFSSMFSWLFGRHFCFNLSDNSFSLE